MRSGKQFMDELYHKYGLLEACRMAEEYLKMQSHTTDAEEKQFCSELNMALNKYLMM